MRNNLFSRNRGSIHSDVLLTSWEEIFSVRISRYVVSDVEGLSQLCCFVETKGKETRKERQDKQFDPGTKQLSCI